MNLTKLLTGNNTAVASIIWPLMIGIFAAACIIYINKRTVGRLVKKLFDEKADTENSAKSLAELGLQKKKYLSYVLRSKSTLHNIIKVVPAEGEAPCRYYIPDETSYRAEAVYKPDGSSPMTIVFAAIAFVIIALVLIHVVPHLLQLTDQAVEGFQNL